MLVIPLVDRISLKPCTAVLNVFLFHFHFFNCSYSVILNLSYLQSSVLIDLTSKCLNFDHTLNQIPQSKTKCHHEEGDEIVFILLCLLLHLDIIGQCTETEKE